MRAAENTAVENSPKKVPVLTEEEAEEWGGISYYCKKRSYAAVLLEKCFESGHCFDAVPLWCRTETGEGYEVMLLFPAIFHWQTTQDATACFLRSILTWTSEDGFVFWSVDSVITDPRFLFREAAERKAQEVLGISNASQVKEILREALRETMFDFYKCVKNKMRFRCVYTFTAKHHQAVSPGIMPYWKRFENKNYTPDSPDVFHIEIDADTIWRAEMESDKASVNAGRVWYYRREARVSGVISKALEDEG
jgi:hypothetical protein